MATAALRLNIQFEYPEDPTVVESFPKLGYHFKDPDNVSLLDVVDKIYREWPEFRPASPPVVVKAVGDAARPDLEFISRATATEVFMDTTKAARDGHDQTATMRVVVDSSSFVQPTQRLPPPHYQPYIQLAIDRLSPQVQEAIKQNTPQDPSTTPKGNAEQIRKRKRKSEPSSKPDKLAEESIAEPTLPASNQAETRKKSRKSEPVRSSQTLPPLPSSQVSATVYPPGFSPAEIEMMRQKAADRLKEEAEKIAEVHRKLNDPDTHRKVKKILRQIVEYHDSLETHVKNSKDKSRTKERIQKLFDELKKKERKLSKSKKTRTEGHASKSSRRPSAVSKDDTESDSDDDIEMTFDDAPESISGQGTGDSDQDVAAALFGGFLDNEAKVDGDDEEDEDEDEEEDDDEVDDEEDSEEEEDDEEEEDAEEDDEEEDMEDSENEDVSRDEKDHHHKKVEEAKEAKQAKSFKGVDEDSASDDQDSTASDEDSSSESHADEPQSKFSLANETAEAFTDDLEAPESVSSDQSAEPLVVIETPRQNSRISGVSSAPEPPQSESAFLLRDLLLNPERLEAAKKAQRVRKLNASRAVFKVSDNSSETSGESDDEEQGDILPDGTSAKLRKPRVRRT